MFQQQNQQLVLDKISQVLSSTDETHAERLLELLDRADGIFVAGAGRSKLVGNFLAMRLMHGGYRVNVVGEIVTPSMQSSDLLIAISGSGQTEQLIAFSRRAKSIGAEVALITAKTDSDLASLADHVFQVGSEAAYGKVKGMPMGTVFELSTLCFLEALVSHLIWEKDVSEAEMASRHANLE